MHTAICTFENPAEADRAVERLLQSGFDRGDVHLEHRHADGTPMGQGTAGSAPLMHGEPAAPGQANDNWDGLEREVAVDAGVVRRLGNFFERLFGHDEGAAGHAASYQGAIDRGHCVVIVEARSDDEAARAQDILHGMNAGDMNLFQRTGQRPLRDVIAERQAAGRLEERFGTARADMGGLHNTDVRAGSDLPRTAREPERAMASQGWGEQRSLDVTEESQPIASPDLRPRGPSSDKPR